MRWARATRFLLPMLCAPLLSAPGPALAADCAEAPGTDAMVECAEADYAAADRRLNSTYAATRQALDAGDGARLLIDAQRLWLKFRDADCRVVAGHAHGGLLSRFLWYSCLADLTRTRTNELEAQAKGLAP